MSTLSQRLLGARRDRAERFLVVTMVAFAVTVATVRWYLDVAGYPTIGSGDIHVAHVLWGGLALFISAMLPLLWVGQRALLVSALLAGIGAGLFIDEVGKFLTASNDYFFAPAAPIIYGVILLLALVWLAVRRSTGDSPSDASQGVIEALRDGVDGSLTGQDRTRAIEKLRQADPDTLAEGSTIGSQLVATLESPAMGARLTAPGWLASGRARALLERSLPTSIERLLIIIGLLWTALQAVVAIAVVVSWDRIIIGGLEALTNPSGPIEIPTEPFWSWLMLGIAIVVGIGSAAAIALAWRGHEREAMRVAVIATLVSLVAGDLVAFYAVQIAALASTVLDLLLLGLILDYRIRIERRATSP